MKGIGETVSDTKESQWIHQLYNKLWVSENMLYDLAKQIKKLSRTDHIDWEKTFFLVEKYNYLKRSSPDHEENDGEQSQFHKLVSEMGRSKELSEDPEFMKELEEHVRKRLNDVGIITH